MYMNTDQFTNTLTRRTHDRLTRLRLSKSVEISQNGDAGEKFRFI